MIFSKRVKSTYTRDYRHMMEGRSRPGVYDSLPVTLNSSSLWTMKAEILWGEQTKAHWNDAKT